MERKRKLFVAKTAIILSAIPVLIWAHSAGPDVGNSGVPGEATCSQAQCHLGTVNGGAGSVAVTFPGGRNYAPGVKQHLIVTISDPAQRRWGFQLAARLSNDSKASVGTFTSTDVNTAVVCGQSSNDLADIFLDFGKNQVCPTAKPFAYMEHTSAGSARFQPNSETYEFDWTPPATDVGSISIYVAGNAANGDNSERGDHIYTKSYTLTPAAAGGNTPTITSVENGGSYKPGIAAGSWVAIKGTNLANTDPGRIWTDSEVVNGNLPTSLDKVGVTINGKAAFVYYISPTQINVQAPTDSSTGSVSVVVTNNGAASPAFAAQLQTYSPAFFQWGATSYAIATRFPDNALIGNPSAVPGTVAAKAGDVLILWGTGFGPTNPSIPAGVVVTGAPVLTNPPVITVGGTPVQVIGAALSPGSAGEYQIAIQLPSSMGKGDQAVQASVQGAQSPASVNLFIGN